MLFSRIAAAALLLLVSGSHAAEPKKETAEQFAERFYTLVLKERPSGIPKAAQWARWRPLFSAEINLGIEKAQEEEAAAAKKNPDEPPLYGDGSLFTSLYEGITHFTVGQPVAAKDGVRVPVALRYVTGTEESKWTDTLVIEPHGVSWRITEIEFGGTWAFKAGEGLRHAIGLRR
jgi:hypothetical protein